MSNYIGDFAINTDVRISFNTNDGDGAPMTLAGSPVVAVYKAGSTTESTAGVTLSVDYDGRTGYHVVTIDTSADVFYESAKDYDVMITQGTVDSVSVAGVCVGRFSLANRAVQAMSSATLAAVEDAVWDAAMAGHATSGSAGKALADASSGASPSAIADAVWDEAIAGHSAAGSTGQALSAAGASGDPWITTLPGSYTSGQAGHLIGTLLDAAISSRSSHSPADAASAVWAAGTRTLTAFSFLTSGGIAAAVWDEDLSGHTTPDSAGEALAVASNATDPWTTTLPGSYTSGQAGHLIGTLLDAAISSRSTYAGSDTPGTAILLSRVPDTISLSAINAQVNAALSDYGAPTKAEMDLALSALESHGDSTWATADVSGLVNDMASAILATPAHKLATDSSGHVTVGTNQDKAGYSLAATPPDASTIASAVWDQSLASHEDAGSAGQVVQAIARQAQDLKAVVQAESGGKR